MPNPPAHYHPLVRSVARALRERCDVEPSSAIVVACSGGADSVALLRALAMLAPRRKWQLRVIVGHINHHLRNEADDDAAFVEALAGVLSLPFARRDIRPADLPGNLEANARDLRYQSLAEIAKEHGASLIATAHHADDQLETLLMRMLRGSSVAGLRGIAWQ
ncbi:MAG: tRNA lysidine(34) synthetase TilS, partial [Phycisphaeraceae bacterium]